MTDFEIASLDYRAASLSTREWTMRIAGAHVAVAAGSAPARTLPTR